MRNIFLSQNLPSRVLVHAMVWIVWDYRGSAYGMWYRAVWYTIPVFCGNWLPTSASSKSDPEPFQDYWFPMDSCTASVLLLPVLYHVPFFPSQLSWTWRQPVPSKCSKCRDLSTQQNCIMSLKAVFVVQILLSCVNTDSTVPWSMYYRIFPIHILTVLYCDLCTIIYF